MNEIVIMFALYCTMCFSPIIEDISTKFQLGYVSCIIVGSHLLANLFFITINTMKLLILILRVRFATSDKQIMRRKYLRSRAKGNVMRRRNRKNRKQEKQKQINDYEFKLDEQHQLPALEALKTEL